MLFNFSVKNRNANRKRNESKIKRRDDYNNVMYFIEGQSYLITIRIKIHNNMNKKEYEIF